MQFVSRAEQERSISSFLKFGVDAQTILSDELFDTEQLPRPIKAVRWKSETDVHKALCITNSLKNTNQFYGNQTIVVRDEVREKTFVISIEQEGLFISLVEKNSLISHSSVYAGKVKRAHLNLRKYDGVPLVSFVASDSQNNRLFINDREIETSCEVVDFPHLAIKQPPIGFAGLEPPNIGVLTYKCRATGKVFLRQINPMSLELGSEIELPISNVLGGAEVAISENESLLKAEVIEENNVKIVTLSSTDFFSTFSDPSGPIDLDLSDVEYDFVIPGISKVFVDHTNVIHLSLPLKAGESTILTDVQPSDERIVAAIQVDKKSPGGVITAFPKMPQAMGDLRFGFGDGETDGAGIIATLISDGSLLASNSQSGGYSYPEAIELNYEMQKMYVYGQTECYTRGIRPNYVSMDYAFVEADDLGRPVSSELWLETWDMVLPEPVVNYEWVDNEHLKILIEKDGWFFPGQTSFWIEPAVVEITEALFVDYREMILKFNNPNRVRGNRIWFETKNVFYYFQSFIDV